MLDNGCAAVGNKADEHNDYFSVLQDSQSLYILLKSWDNGSAIFAILNISVYFALKFDKINLDFLCEVEYHKIAYILMQVVLHQ